MKKKELQFPSFNVLKESGSIWMQVFPKWSYSDACPQINCRNYKLNKQHVRW